MPINSEIVAQLSSLNLAAAVERVGGDEELLVDIAGVYLAEYPSLMEEIAKAVAAGDAAGLTHSAHTLKGSLATIGAERAASIALRLEMMGRHADTSSARPALESLQAAVQVVHRDLDVLIG
ncbi:MAG: Hpt domain-containing protein [Bryobacteraceae bacterium]